MKKQKNDVDILLVSYDNVSNDKPVLIVGRKGAKRTGSDRQCVSG